MAEYSYRALDSQGRSQEGVVKARSQAQVRTYLLREGLSPLHIAPVQDPILASQRRPKARNFKGPGWQQRLASLRFDSPPVWALCGVLAVMGLASFQWKSWKNPTKTVGAAALKAQSCRYEVQGEIVGRIRPEDSLTLVFPEIPLQIRRRWKELEHPEPRKFYWPVEFRSQVVPTRCYLRLGERNLGREQGIASIKEKIDWGLLSTR